MIPALSKSSISYLINIDPPTTSKMADAEEDLLIAATGLLELSEESPKKFRKNNDGEKNAVKYPLISNLPKVLETLMFTSVKIQKIPFAQLSVYQTVKFEPTAFTSFFTHFSLDHTRISALFDSISNYQAELLKSVIKSIKISRKDSQLACTYRISKIAKDQCWVQIYSPRNKKIVHFNFDPSFVGIGTFKQIKKSISFPFPITEAERQSCNFYQTVIIKNNQKKFDNDVRVINFIGLHGTIVNGLQHQVSILDHVHKANGDISISAPLIYSNNREQLKIEVEQPWFNGDYANLLKYGTLPKTIFGGESSMSLTYEKRLDILMDVAETVKKMHAAGWIHGDIKSQNVLIKVEEQKFKPFLTDLDFTQSKSGNFITPTEYCYFDKCAQKGILLWNNDIFGLVLMIADTFIPNFLIRFKKNELNQVQKLTAYYEDEIENLKSLDINLAKDLMTTFNKSFRSIEKLKKTIIDKIDSYQAQPQNLTENITGACKTFKMHLHLIYEVHCYVERYINISISQPKLINQHQDIIDNLKDLSKKTENFIKLNTLFSHYPDAETIIQYLKSLKSIINN